MTYQVHFLNHARKDYLIRPLEAEHDEAAIAKSRDLYSAPIGLGYEIRDKERLVHAHEY